MRVRPDYTAFNPDEVRWLAMDYKSDLATDETIDSVVVTLQVVGGTDADPNSHVIGDAVIDGTNVTQMIGPLVAGVYYALVFTVTTSTGQVLPDYAGVRCQAITL